MSEATSPNDSRRAATFFDVDGTIVASTIVHYYAYFKKRRLSPLIHGLWYGAFVLKCGYYLVLDRINRSAMNRVFYRSYRNLLIDEIKALRDECYRDVLLPRRFAEAVDCVREHQQSGRDVVLVTGSLDFIMEPLASDLGIQHMIASRLLESDGQFTGELAGLPIGEEEKARRVRVFAEEHDIDLAASYGYGDSIADLPMLEILGHPAVVNPDKSLSEIARTRGWPEYRWKLQGEPRGEPL